MKPLILSTIVFFVLSIAVSSSAVAECTRQTEYPLKYITDSIKKDLISAAWTTDVLGVEADVFFHADGLAESIHTSGRTAEVQFLQWDVTMVDGGAILAISAPDGTSKSLLISPTCEGFVASDAFGVKTHILMYARETSARLEMTRSQMAGVWKSIRKSTGTRDVQWGLKCDGTFTLAVAPDMYHAAHQGVWDITSDGQYLLLYFTRDANPESVYATEIARIKSVDFEDLLLDVQDLSIVFGNLQAKEAERGFVKEYSM